MNKNTIFPNLIQKFVAPEELELLIEAVGYEDTAHKLDVMALIQYLITAATCEWKSFRYCADVARYLKIKAIPTEAPTGDEIEAIRQGREEYANGEFYRFATIDELRAGFEKVNEMIMNRKE